MQAPSIDDQRKLFQRVTNGDVSAFSILFEAYRARLYAAALKIIKSDYAAEEIVQEIFTSLWESRSNLVKVDNPPAYIFTIAYNKTFRYLKKLAADSALCANLVRQAKERGSDTEEWLEAKESEQFIDRAVEEMPPQRQLIYRLSRKEGLSHKEIADQLNISPLTVKKQLTLALRNIRSFLVRTGLLVLFLSFYDLL